MPYSARMQSKAPPYRSYRYAAAKTIQDAVRRKQKAPKAMTAKSKPKPKASNYRLTAPMRTLVDKRIDRKLETKELRYMLWSPTDGNGTTAYTLRNEISYLSIKPLLCPISQDNDPLANSAFRLGNVIMPTHLSVRVKLYLKVDEDPQGTGAGDRGAIQPYLFVGHNKNIKNIVNLTANNYASTIPFIWRTSSINPSPTQEAPGTQGEVGSFTGYRDEYVLGRYNDSLLRPIKGGIKQPVITRPVGFYQNPVPTEGGGGFATSHVERNYVFNVPVPKKLTYSNNEAEFPDNFAPFLMCGFTYVAGAEPSIQAPLRIETCVHFKYKDA